MSDECEVCEFLPPFQPPEVLHSPILMDGERVGLDDDFEFIEEGRGIVIEDHVGRKLAVAELLDDVGDTVTDAAGVREDPHRSSFVVGDRELVEGPDAAGDENNRITGADVDDVTLHEAHARVDHHVMPVGREILVGMLVLRKRRRDPQRESVCFLRPQQRVVRQTRAGTVDEDVTPLGNLSAQLTRRLTTFACGWPLMH